MANKEYQRVIDHICQEIYDGKLGMGERLPTERSLAEQMGVGRGCVREAMRIMETFGMVECRQGSGNYVVCRMSEPISEIFSMMLLLGATNMNDVKEFRMELDKQACRALAAREDRVQIADELSAILDRAPKGDLAREIDMDAQFHRALLQLENNRVWMTIAEAILPVYRRGIRDTLLHMDHEQADITYERHRQICEGIRNGAYEACERAIEEHYSLYDTD